MWQCVLIFDMKQTLKSQLSNGSACLQFLLMQHHEYSIMVYSNLTIFIQFEVLLFAEISTPILSVWFLSNQVLGVLFCFALFFKASLCFLLYFLDVKNFNILSLDHQKYFKGEQIKNRYVAFNYTPNQDKCYQGHSHFKHLLREECQ